MKDLQNKRRLSWHTCQEKKCKALCIQESHRVRHLERPKVEDMYLIVERLHNKHTVFARNEITIKSTLYTKENGVEIIIIEPEGCIVTSIIIPQIRYLFSKTKILNFRGHQYSSRQLY